MSLKNFFSMSAPAAPLPEGQVDRTYKRLRWQVLVAATIGYSLFYVCRLGWNIVKKALMDGGVLSVEEVGLIGGGLFVTYAIGKFTNGFLADRSNIRRFMSVGLLVSGLINLALGFTTAFAAFMVMWTVNGWAQSMGAAPSVVSLSRWFGDKERSTYYGIWSESHYIGSGLTYLIVPALVTAAGWQWGLRGVGLVGILGALIVAVFLRDTPQSCGLPSIAEYQGDTETMKSQSGKSVGDLQKQVLKNPAIWTLAIASAFMYISRYAVESWGPTYLSGERGFSLESASLLTLVFTFSGLLGTFISGFLADKFFKHSCRVPAFLSGVLNVMSLLLFFFGPSNTVFVVFSLFLVGTAIGALVCYLGGMMAVEIAPKKASGAALGTVGLASYLATALNEVVSGQIIHVEKLADGTTSYDFTLAIWVWVGAALLSAVVTALIKVVAARQG